MSPLLKTILVALVLLTGLIFGLGSCNTATKRNADPQAATHPASAAPAERTLGTDQATSKQKGP